MNQTAEEAAEEASSAIALVGAVRESVARSREPAHFYGLVRGLDIALATLRDSRHDVRGAIQQLRERASRLAENDAYGAGVAIGLEFASDLTMRGPYLHSLTSRHSVLAADEAHSV